MDDRFTSPQGIAELNIEHYRKLLQSSLDAQTRARVEKLLEEERAKLAKLLRDKSAVSCLGGASFASGGDRNPQN